jgi:HK97 family phage major capsid protein
MFRKVLDGDNRPIFQRGGAAGPLSGEPDTLDLVPVVINQDMAVPASAAKSAVLWYPAKYIVRRVRNIELYRVMNDTASVRSRTTRFVAYARMDARAMPASAGAFKYLTHT